MTLSNPSRFARVASPHSGPGVQTVGSVAMLSKRKRVKSQKPKANLSKSIQRSSARKNQRARRRAKPSGLGSIRSRQKIQTPRTLGAPRIPSPSTPEATALFRAVEKSSRAFEMKLFILGSYGARFVNAMKAGNVSFLGQTYANGSVFIQARITQSHPIETISVKVHGKTSKTQCAICLSR